jgi:hypothetical protein
VAATLAEDEDDAEDDDDDEESSAPLKKRDIFCRVKKKTKDDDDSGRAQYRHPNHRRPPKQDCGAMGCIQLSLLQRHRNEATVEGKKKKKKNPIKI